MRRGFYRRLEALMAMDAATWARHANPWSGWTRVASLPLLALAIWSRAWIGWGALGAVALVALWIWLNPRLFPPPRRHDAWMTRGVLGERILLEYGAEVPAHHRAVTTRINWLTLPGSAAMGWGLWVLDPALTVLGVWMTMLPKLWFLDRMVWLHGEWVAAGRAVPGAAAVTGEGRG